MYIIKKGKKKVTKKRGARSLSLILVLSIIMSLFVMPQITAKATGGVLYPGWMMPI